MRASHEKVVKEERSMREESGIYCGTSKLELLCGNKLQVLNTTCKLRSIVSGHIHKKFISACYRATEVTDYHANLESNALLPLRCTTP